MRNNPVHTATCKKRSFFQLRDAFILITLILDINWLVILSFVFWLLSVIWQLRNDWRTYRKIDLFTLFYVLIMSFAITLIALRIFG